MCADLREETPPATAHSAGPKRGPGRAEGIPISRSTLITHMPDKNPAPPICTILTVDDEIGIDSFFYEFFTARNYRVLTASSGKEALAIVRKDHPQIVLLDINMRGMDGIEALKRIKEFDKRIMVIMVTGLKGESVKREALSAGADEFITKPLSLEYLDKVVFLKFLDQQLRSFQGD